MVGTAGSQRRVTAPVGGAALLLVVVILAAAGCGGNSDKKANEAYADNVCKAVGSWETQIKTIATSFNGDVSQSAVQSKVSDAKTATKQLATDIAAVPPPDTEAGRAAKQQLDQLATDASTSVTAAQAAADKIKADASVAEITATLVALVPQLKTLAETTSTAITSLKDAGGSLASAFKSADSCKSLSPS
jgi:hypothetical protein